MPSTRSKPATEVTSEETKGSTSNSKRKIPQSVDVPNKTFILPSKRSEVARFISLPNPSSRVTNRYFFDPESAGLYEFTAVASTQFAPRSILITPNNDNNGKAAAAAAKSYIAKKAELLIATPIDVLFFMLPIIAPADKTSTSNMFQPLDDILDSQDELSAHLRYILYNTSFRPTLERRMQSICDTMEAGGEKLYRFNETKLLTELIAKADRMIAQGLPASLEENFIHKALAPPLMSVKREDTGTTATTLVENENSQDLEVVETQSTSTTTASTTVSEQQSGVSTPATQPPTVDEISSSSESTARLLRLRIALSFIKQSYLPQNLSTKIEETLKSPESPIDFTPLENRLKELAALRAEAFASRAIGGDFTRKRGFEDEDGDSARVAAKRRKDEEKKAKAAESRGVRDLKKSILRE
uniref:Ribonuclease H2 subunit B n=1 Tax=Talaromyces marneffei PM1 TaxID=1077442 RepID=A0A093VDK7_TALMA